MKWERRHFIAKHDLASFMAWPGVIWRTGEAKFPRGLRKIDVGDRWVEFAYIKDEDEHNATSQVVGFYECISVPTARIEIPSKPRSLAGNSRYAWAIKGRAIGWQPSFPVTVPSVNTLLGRVAFGRQVLTPVSKDEFDLIRQRVKGLKLEPKRIPLLHRDPRNEQEVVSIIVSAHSHLGIERIDRVRCGFPDLRVKIVGKRDLVHLEVETYSSNFIAHQHHLQVRSGYFRTKDKSEKLPVAVVCWCDDDKDGAVVGRVHKIFELRSLLQRNEKIRWGR
jgi:hypothetical protein